VQKLAILGANGLIMESLLEAIGKHPSLSGEIVLLGSAESIDTSVEFGQQTLSIADIEGQGFEEIDLVIATGEMPYEGDWLDRARHAGCVILDISGHLPGQQHRVGVVAGVNDALLDEVVPGDVVVLPDAATVQSATLLHPLLQKLEIERVSLFSCHSFSERGVQVSRRWRDRPCSCSMASLYDRCGFRARWHSTLCRWILMKGWGSP
jgi:aspartate-semialdehyde dehydrogenase